MKGGYSEFRLLGRGLSTLKFGTYQKFSVREPGFGTDLGTWGLGGGGGGGGLPLKIGV